MLTKNSREKLYINMYYIYQWLLKTQTWRRICILATELLPLIDRKITCTTQGANYENMYILDRLLNFTFTTS